MLYDITSQINAILWSTPLVHLYFVGRQYLLPAHEISPSCAW